MDRGKPTAADPAPADADADADELALYMHAMDFGEASSSQQPPPPPPPPPQQLHPWFAMPVSPLMKHAPPQGLRAAEEPELMQKLKMTQELWLQPSYGVEEGSSINGFVQPPPFPAYATPFATEYVSPFPSHQVPMYGAFNPALVTPAASRYSPVQRPGTLRASASQYQPVGAASASSVAASPSSMASSSGGQYYQPIAAAPGSSVAPSPSSMASSSGGHYYQPSTNNYYQRSASSYQHGCAYAAQQEYRETAALLDRLRAAKPGNDWRCAAPIRQGRTLDEVRRDLLRGPMELSLVLFPESAAHVVRLLQEGEDAYRLSVLAGVRRYVHRIMDNREGHVVLIALLHACRGRYGELHDIVKAATTPSAKCPQPLMRAARQEYGEAALKELISTAAPYSEMCLLLTDRLVQELLMDHSKGEELLRWCFKEMRYEDSCIFIRFAIFAAEKMLKSSFGSRCLAVCFANSQNEELFDMENLILRNASAISKGQYSNYFAQCVLEKGSEQLKRNLVARLMEDVVSLSRHQFGSYVVESCFLRTGASPPLLHLVLTSFLSLPDHQLSELVQCGFANFVVHKLIDHCKDRLPDLTLELVRRIEKLPADVLDQMHSRQVMRIIRKLFPKEQRLF